MLQSEINYLKGTRDMTKETYIKGKERSLESTIDTMYKKLQTLDIRIDEVSALNPVPFVYSQHIRDESLT